MVREILRVLRQGGYVLVTIPIYHYYQPNWRDDLVATWKYEVIQVC